jgi:hypothetical protein
VKEGFQALRGALRSLGADGEESLVTFVRERRRRARMGRPLGAHATRAVVDEAHGCDDRVSILETVARELVLTFGRRAPPPPRQTKAPRRSARQRVPAEPPEDSWPQLDSVSLGEFSQLRIPTLRSCPAFVRGRCRFALIQALDRGRRARAQEHDEDELRAWKLFALLPAMLLHRPRDTGTLGRLVLEKRFDDLARGDWSELLADAAAMHALGAHAKVATSRHALGTLTR